MADNEVSMIMSVYPGAMTGFSAMYAGVSSINNIFMQTMSRIDDNFNILDSSIIGTGALLAQVGMKAMDAYGQMEQSMKIVQMVSGQTADDIGFLSQKANEFSVQYRTDIDQITEGLQTLGRAGLNSAAEQSQVLENGLTTAKLEGRELNSVLEELIQNTALLGGDLKSNSFGEQSQYVNDLLVATSMTAPIDTHDVSETLKYSGGIAAAAGANIESAENKAILEDYMGAIAAFAQKGVSGSIAGTALRAFFNKPATQDSSVVEGLAAIKLKPEYLWEDDQQTMKPISAQIGLIQNQMDKLDISTMDRLQIWSKIVGGKMGQQMMKLDSSDIKSLTSDIRAADSAEKLATGSMKTYEANVKATQESFAKLERNVGEVLVKYVNPLLEFGNKILGFLNNDFSASVLAVSFIGFMGIVITKVKSVFGTIKSEIAEVWAALKGGNQVNVRDMRGNTKTGKRKPLSEFTVEGAQTPAQIKEAFEKKFAQDSMNIYKNWDAIDIAVNEQTKGWSAQTKNKGLLKAGEKYGFSTRDADMIRSLLEHKKMSDEVKTILASKGNKSFKMGSVLESGQTVNEYIEEEYKKLQAEINQAFSTAQRKTKELNKKIDSFFDGDNKTEKTGKEYLEKKHGVKSKQDEDLKSKKEEVVESTQKEISTKEREKKANEELAFWIDKVNDASEEAIIKKQLEYDEKVNNYGGQSSYIGNKNIPILPENVVGSFTSINPSMLTPISKDDFNHIKDTSSFWDFFNQTYSTKSGKQAFYWSNHDLGLQVDPTKYIMNNPQFVESFINGVLPNLTFDDFKSFAQSSKGKIPKNKLMEAYNVYMNHLQQSLDAFVLEQIKQRDIGSLSAAELHTYAPALSNGLVKGWRGPNSRTAEDVRNELAAYNYVKDLTAPTLAKMLREYGTDIGAGKGIGKDDRIKMLLPLMAEDLKEHNNLLTERLKLYKELEKAATLPGYVDPNTLNSDEVQKYMKDQEEQIAAQNSYTPGHVSPTVVEEAKRKNEAAKQEKELKDKLLTAQNQANSIQKEVNEVQEKINNEALKEKRQKELELFRRKKQERENYVNPVPSSEELRERYGVVTRPTPVPWDGVTPWSFRQSINSAKEEVTGFFGGIKDSFKDHWKADRSQRFNFGTVKNAEGQIVSATKGLRGFGNGILNITDMFGGPLMAASVAFSVIAQTYNYYLQEFNKKIEEANNKISEASQKVDEAQDIFFNGKDKEGEAKITGWLEDHPDATAEEKEDALLGAYEQIYDHSTEGLSSLDANTQQLAIATEELKRATDQYGTEWLNDPNFNPRDGRVRFDTIKNAVMSSVSGFTTPIMAAIDGSTLVDKFGEKSRYTRGDYLDAEEFQIQDWQKQDDYHWGTEMASLMAANNWYHHGNRENALKDLLGSRGYSALNEYIGSVNSDRTFGNQGSRDKSRVGSADPWTRSAWNIHSQNLGTYFKDNKDMNRLQFGLQQYGKQFSKLAKQTRRFEKATGKTALGALTSEYNKERKSSGGKAMKNALKNLQVTDPKLVAYIKSLAIDTGMSEQQVLMAAQLQQLQEMHDIGQNQVAPRMESLVGTAYQQVAYSGQTAGQVNGSGSGAVSAAQNAAAIANLLGVMMEEKLDEQNYQDYLNNLSDPSQAKYKDAQTFAAASRNAYKNGEDNWLAGYYEKKQQAHAATNYMLYNPDLSPEDAQKRASEWWKGVEQSGASVGAIQDTLRKGTNTALANEILAAYDAQLDQEDGGDSGGGGSGSGSGSGSGNKGSGTRRERVDLVLCNKKEIPKLNVNLFKKPPSFTILNKNFKLRDVKINSEDKPKAIMAAIKNSFIDIQKRTDPKIIQDEDAVYDPKAATDGTNLPSGSAKTKTDNN